MKRELKPGDAAELATLVLPQHTITLGGDPAATVLATPHLINLMEHAARNVLAPVLDAGEESVGVTVNVSHQAATPMGGLVRAVAKVRAVAGRLIDFDLLAFDDKEQVGAGTHRRAVIDLEKFVKRLAQGNTAPGGVTGKAGGTMSETPPPTKLVKMELAGQVATLTLDRPAQLNVLNRALTGELEAIVGWLGLHPEAVRVVILTGAGGNFCAGDDIKELAVLSKEEIEAFNLQEIGLFERFGQIPQPMIAAISGACFGGGCVAAYGCDFRIAGFDAKFGMPEIKLGWPPSFGVADLVQQVGLKNATDLCLTGRTISARAAKDLGLLHEVVPAGGLLRRARELAEELLAKPATALRETKVLLRQMGWQPPAVRALDHAAYLRCQATNDAKEGAAAFLEKRKPKFTGR